MNWRTSLFLLLSVVAYGLFLPHLALSQDNPWKKIDDGLYLIESPVQKITILKADPRYYSFKLLCASENNNLRLTPKKWCQKYNLVSAINAGMYQTDGVSNVGYMKNFSHLNNPRISTRYKAVLAFNPADVTVPEVQIIDLTCQDFDRLKDKYQTLIQGIRMVSCRQENVWEKQDKMWSIAACGIDKSGKGLFIFTETPYSVHDFINILLSLPISLYNAMYLEGGPYATLYLSAKEVEFEKIGTYEVGLSEPGSPKISLPVPNVIGIARK